MNLSTVIAEIENRWLVSWMGQVCRARRRNLSGEPEANQINFGAEPDKLDPSKTPTNSSI